jgi:hypothetical protein
LHQFGGINFEACVSFADSSVLTGNDSAYVPFVGNDLPYEDSTAFLGVGLPGELP